MFILGGSIDTQLGKDLQDFGRITSDNVDPGGKGSAETAICLPATFRVQHRLATSSSKNDKWTNVSTIRMVTHCRSISLVLCNEHTRNFNPTSLIKFIFFVEILLALFTCIVCY